MVPLNNKQLMLAIYFDWKYFDTTEVNVMVNNKVESFYLDMFVTNICLN
jgi:hypothetical protein